MSYEVALQQHGREKHCIEYSGINVFADTSKTTKMSLLNELIIGYPEAPTSSNVSSGRCESE